MNWKPAVNVGHTERLAAGIIGAILLAGAFRPLRPWRLYGAACLFYRALSGHCKTYELLDISTVQAPRKR